MNEPVKTGSLRRFILWSLLLILAFVAGINWPRKDKVVATDRIIVEVTSIYDGDTFRCNIPNYPPIIGDRMPIRIANIDTPEITGEEKEEGRISKQFVVEKIRAAKNVEIRNLKRGKFFRIVADVYLDGEDLGQMLLDAGLAEKYDD